MFNAINWMRLHFKKKKNLDEIAYAVVMWAQAYSKFSPTSKWTLVPNSPTIFGPHLSNGPI